MTKADELSFRFHSAIHRDGLTARDRRMRQDAADAIMWYVSTGRASYAWICAAMKATPDKLLDWVRDGSVQDQVERATAYLQHHCGLPKPPVYPE